MCTSAHGAASMNSFLRPLVLMLSVVMLVRGQTSGEDRPMWYLHVAS